MKYFILMTYILTNFLAQANDDVRHMVSFGRKGVGWVGSYEVAKTNNGSPFDEMKYFLSDLSLNYAYLLSKRWQVGGHYQTAHSEYKFKQSDTSAVAKLLTTVYGAFGLYNFSDKLINAYYVGFSLSYFTVEEENSPKLVDAENKSPFELDNTGNLYEMILGKRFSLKGWGVNQLTYSPNFSVFYRNHGRDFDDQGIGGGSGISIQPIKFDFLF